MTRFGLSLRMFVSNLVRTGPRVGPLVEPRSIDLVSVFLEPSPHGKTRYFFWRESSAMLTSLLTRLRRPLASYDSVPRFIGAGPS